MRLLLLLSLLAGTAAAAAAQQPSDIVYDRSTLARIDLTMPPDSLARVLSQPLSDREVPATFTFRRGALVETVERVGFRIRGNTSRAAVKKSFKVSMNTYVRGRAWRGLEKLNLNGEHNDPSMLRSTVGWALFADARLPAPRSSHAELYLNGAFYGVYTNVEQLDETFLGRRFGTPDGVLFKCLYPADLAYRGPTGASYVHRDGSGRIVYEFEQGADSVAAYDVLAGFVSLLHTTPAGSFAPAIEQAFDVNGFLKTLAVDVIAGSWDNYWYNQNNYYLAFDPATSRATYLPYDYDNTLGIDFVGRDWGTRNPYTWGASSGRPLASKILAVPDFRARYTFYLRQLLGGAASEARLFPRVDSLRALLDEAAGRDTYRTQDYGFTLLDFRMAADQAWGGHVAYGIKPYLRARRASLLSALDATNVPPIVHLPAPLAPRPTTADSLTIAVRVEDESVPAFVGLLDGVATIPPQRMYDDGTHGDVRAGDGVYTLRLAPARQPGTRTYTATATDAAGQTRTSPMLSLRVTSTATGLVVNEFVASNDGQHRDGAGDADDWIEIHNPTAAPVRLLGYTLTDNLASPAKWAFPDTTLAPGAYAVVWADEEAAEGPMHAAFKLGASGESVGLFHGSIQVDAVTFPAQTLGVAWGRSPNATGAFGALPRISPGAANPLASAAEGEAPAAAGMPALFPTPFHARLTVTLPRAEPAGWTVTVYDLLGRALERTLAPAGTPAVSIGAGLSPGVYVVRVESGRTVHTLRAVKR